MVVLLLRVDCQNSWVPASADHRNRFEEGQAMTEFTIYDRVVAKAEIPQAGVAAGAIGTVVELYDDGALEVEFPPDSERNLVLVSVQPEHVALAKRLKQAA